MADISVTRIEEGHRAASSQTGGYAYEYFLVSGVPTDQAQGSDANAAGLPKLGSYHPVFSNLTAREIVTYQIIDNITTIVMVQYRWANFATGINRTSREQTDNPERLRLFFRRDTSGGKTVWTQLGDSQSPLSVYERFVSRRVVRVYSGGNPDEVSAKAQKNIGCWYILGSGSYALPYLLIASPVWQQPDGRVYADYTYITKAPIFKGSPANPQAIPAGTYPGQDIAIPIAGQLDRVDAYFDFQANTPVIRVTPYAQAYPPGAPLY
jgi:hypothetical protein